MRKAGSALGYADWAEPHRESRVDRWRPAERKYPGPGPGFRRHTLTGKSRQNRLLARKEPLREWFALDAGCGPERQREREPSSMRSRRGRSTASDKANWGRTAGYSGHSVPTAGCRSDRRQTVPNQLQTNRWSVFGLEASFTP